MSKILLISANRCTTPEPVFPLGLAYLGAALRRARHDCVWLDCLTNGDKLIETLNTCRPDFVGISLRNIDDVLIRKKETFFDSLISLTATIRRESNCPIILGGSGFSIFPAPLLELTGADFGIAGEGEWTFVELIEALESGRDYEAIAGLVFHKNKEVVANPSPLTSGSHRLLEVDAEPLFDKPNQISKSEFPARLVARSNDGIADTAQFESIIGHYLRNGGILNAQTQRGCAHRCCYCTYPIIEGRRHRPRPAELVAEEFERLQRLGACYVFIVDSVFNSSPGHVVEICEALLQQDVKLPWGCFLRPQGLDRELMRLMARAGLKHIEFGSDSFCDEVLEAYQKGLTLGDIYQASELARQEKLDFCHFLIVGGPGETRETMQRSFENSRRIEGGVIMAVVGMRIYPGTELFNTALAEGQITESTNLLTPAYYLAPGLKAEEIFARIREFARDRPNWLVGDPDSTYQGLVTRLRQRGVVGPLWSYFAMIQQVKPQELAREKRPATSRLD